MKRLLLLAVLGFCSMQLLHAQATTQTYYAQRTSNYYTNTGEGTYGIFNQGTYQVGQYANTSGNKRSVAWRKFNTNADGSSTSNRALQVGDVFVVTLSATQAYGRIGFALLASPSSTSSWADRENNYALSVNLDGPKYTGNGTYGAWYAKYAGGTTSTGDNLVYGQQTNYRDVTITVTLTAPDRANIVIASTYSGTTNTSYQFDRQLNTSNPITDYSIFLEDDWDGGASRNVYWGLGQLSSQHSLANGKDMPFGSSTGDFTVGTVLSDGLVSNSASTASPNTLTKTGLYNLTLTAQNTYTGTTHIYAGKVTLNRTGGSTLPATNDVVVYSGGNLTVNTNQTLNNLTINSGASVTVSAGATLTINGTCQVSGGTSFNGTGTVTFGPNATMQINQGAWPGNTNTFSWGNNSTLQFAHTSGSYGVNSTDTWWTNSSYPSTVIVPSAGITLNTSRNAANVTANGTISLGSNNLTIQSGTLTLNSGGSVTGSGSVSYAGTSSLLYNQTGSVSAGREWTGTLGGTTSVTVQNGTSVNLGSGSTNFGVSGNLTLGSGTTAGSLSMGAMTGKLTVSGDLLIGGNSAGTSTLTLSSAGGGNLEVYGNWSRTAQGSFSNSGNRTVSFLGTGTATFSANGGGTINNVVLNKTGGLTLQSNLTVGSSLTLTAGSLATSGNALSIGGTLSLGTGSINAASGTVSFNGSTAQAIPSGSFSALQHLTINNAAGVTSAGSLTLSGDLALTAGTLSMGGNTLTIGGNVTRTAGSVDASAGTLVFNGSAAQSIQSGSIAGTLNNLTINNSSGATPAVTINASRTLTGVLTLTQGQFSANGNALTIATTGSVVRGNGSLDAAITYASNADLTYTNTAAITAGYEIPASNTVRNLTMNSSADVALSANLTVTGALTFTAGKLDIGNNNLTVSGGTAGSGSTTSYVKTSGSGVLKILNVGSSPVTFPVGNSSYNPVAISNPVTLDWSVNVADAISNVTSAYSSNIPKSVSRQWDITPSQNSPAPGGGATITFYYNGTTDVGASFNNSTTMQVWHYYQGFWAKRGGAVTPGTDNGMKTVTVSGLTYFSPYALSNSDAPLPVTFLSFTGKRNGTVNELGWKTATEQNNRGFAVERSQDGVSFTQVGFVATRAQGGTSTSDISYSFTDASTGSAGQAANSKWYYRLKQVDLDGRYKYSSVVLLKSDKSGVITVEGIYPNPVKASASVRLQAPASGGQVLLQLTDMQGRIVKVQSVLTEGGSSSTVSLDLSGLAAGSYHLRAIAPDGSGSEVVTVVKQ